MLSLMGRLGGRANRWDNASHAVRGRGPSGPWAQRTRAGVPPASTRRTRRLLALVVGRVSGLVSTSGDAADGDRWGGLRRLTNSDAESLGDVPSSVSISGLRAAYWESRSAWGAERRSSDASLSESSD